MTNTWDTLSEFLGESRVLVIGRLLMKAEISGEIRRLKSERHPGVENCPEHIWGDAPEKESPRRSDIACKARAK